MILQGKLLKGLLPSPAAEWPAEPFRSAFLASLNKMEMPRFTRRHPQLLEPLLKQMLALIHVRLHPYLSHACVWDSICSIDCKFQQRAWLLQRGLRCLPNSHRLYTLANLPCPFRVSSTLMLCAGNSAGL